MGNQLKLCLEDKPQSTSQTPIYYDGDHFVVPSSLTFEKQSTFTQVEQAARVFCQRNQISMFYMPLMSRIVAYNHSKAFDKIWKGLSEQQKEQFLQDLNTIEHDLMDSMYHFFITPKPQLFQLQLTMHKPHMITVDSDNRLQQLKRKGQSLLKEGKMAFVLMCAGPCTRYRRMTNQERLLTPLLPNKDICILDLLMLRLRRNLNGSHISIFVSCNAQNYQPIAKHIAERQYYGLGIQNYSFFINPPLAIFNKRGQYQLDENKQLIKRSNGSAYCAQKMFSPQCRDQMQKKGIEWVFFSGTQNLFQNPCDPVFLGLIAESGKPSGSKCTSIQFYEEQLPRYYASNNTGLGFLSVSELVKEDLAKLSKLPIALNSIVFQMSQLRRVVKEFDSSTRLAQKYQAIYKQQRVFDFQRGVTNFIPCFSFESDLRYYLTCSKATLLYYIPRRGDYYVPIITKNSEYSLSNAMQYFGPRILSEISQLHSH